MDTTGETRALQTPFVSVASVVERCRGLIPVLALVLTLQASPSLGQGAGDKDSKIWEGVYSSDQVERAKSAVNFSTSHAPG